MARLVVMLLIMAGTIYGLWSTKKSEPSVHYHAGFVVYVDGEKQDFSDFKYMNFTPCGEHSKKRSSEEEQIEKAHLHDSVGDVVHVHRTGGTWGDLFQNIKYTFPTDKELIAYKNGIQVDNFLAATIQPNESIVIVVGEKIEDASLSYVPQTHIQEIEVKSELCGSGD